ncbi:MAG: APA family basic amino acid/polyamine antiporter [Candidatus Azotimanducaceae bacterium]|jgi:APA family basic amino acid/polyamine antiporter
MAEETIDPSRNLPIAILGSLVIAAILYFLVTYVAVTSVPVNELANHSAPMALIVERHGIFNPNAIALTSILAVTNGDLVQIITASRVIYGVAKMKNENHFLTRVNRFTQTPTVATALVGLCTLALALSFDLRELASLTSAITLGVFLVVNLSLCKLQGTPNSLIKLLPWLAVALNVSLLLLAFKSL